MASDGERGKARLVFLLLLVGAALGVRSYLLHRAQRGQAPAKPLPKHEVVLADAGGVLVKCQTPPKGTVRHVRTSLEMATGGSADVRRFMARRTDRLLDPEGGRVEHVFHEAVVKDSAFPGAWAAPDLEKPYVVKNGSGELAIEPEMSEAQLRALPFLIQSFDHLCESWSRKPLQLGDEVKESRPSPEAVAFRFFLDRVQAEGREVVFRVEQPPVDSGTDAVTFESVAGARLILRVSDGQPIEFHYTTRMLFDVGTKPSFTSVHVDYTATFD